MEKRKLTLDMSSAPLSRDQVFFENTATFISLNPKILQAQVDLELKPDLAQGTHILAFEEASPSDTQYSIPRFTSSFKELEAPCSLVIWQEQSSYYAILSLVSGSSCCQIHSNSTSLSLSLLRRKGSSSLDFPPLALFAKSENFYELTEELIKLIQVWTPRGPNSFETSALMPEWMTSVGWSSEKLGEDLSHSKIIETLKRIIRKQKLHYVILNLGWQNLNSSQELSSFEACQKKFPEGLSRLIEDIRSLEIEHVGIEHPCLGGLGGLNKELRGENGKNTESKDFFLDLGRSFEFYHDYYQFLSRFGVDFVVLNGRYNICFDHPLSEIETIQNSFLASQAAAALHFNSPQLHTHSLGLAHYLPSLGNLLIQTIPSSTPIDPKTINQSIRDHFLQSLRINPASKPCFSSFSSSSKHAGHKLLSHLPNKLLTLSNIDPIEIDPSLTLNSGKTFKADTPLLPLKRSALKDPLLSEELFITYTSKKSHLICPIFNLSIKNKIIKDHLSPSDHPFCERENYAVVSNKRGFLGCLNSTDLLDLSLGNYEAELITFCPIYYGVAILGDLNLDYSMGPIDRYRSHMHTTAIHTLNCGTMTLYSERCALEVRQDEELIPFDLLGDKLISFENKKGSSFESSCPSVFTIQWT